LLFKYRFSEGDNSSIQGDVLHEVAHHWVGNLVGMSTKMKEGIVQYIERLFAERLFGPMKKSGRRNAYQQKLPISKSNSMW
jgi:aminopeptidase N